MKTAQSGRVVIFGEVLFDCFPDGKVVMGGAPLNVAWHLQGFGLDPLLISRLGKDEQAQLVITRFREWGMDLSGIQQDSLHSTGRVEISLDNGQPDFSILADQAYDYIDIAETERTLGSQDVALLYHGSLAARNITSLQTLQLLRKRYSDRIFVDINLRAPWWNTETVKHLVTGAQWLKLNDTELLELSGEDKQAVEIMAANYIKDYNCQQLILTQGDKGACVVEADRVIKGNPVPVKKVVDTVGAGDAFSAVMIVGFIHGWSPGIAMSRALEFASLICAVRGATIPDSSRYKELLAKWGVK